MRKYVLYQTDKTVGVVSQHDRPQYAYEKEIKPIRVLLCDISDEGIASLMEILEHDMEQFVDIIQEELYQNFSTLYMN